MDKLLFCAGALTSAAWLILNFTLTCRLLSIALLRKPGPKLSVLLLIKFPLLYLLGFLILISGAFSSFSLVLGLSLGFLFIGVKSIWLRLV